MEGLKQATSRYCFVCGVENPAGLHLHFYTVGPGEVVAEYVVTEQFNGYPGIVHGGILATMLDEVMGRVFMYEDQARFMVTGEIKVRYKKPVYINQPLRICGHRVKDTGRIGIARGEITDVNGEVLVTGEILVVNKPGPQLSTAELEEMGWKVYPEEEKHS